MPIFKKYRKRKDSKTNASPNEASPNPTQNESQKENIANAVNSSNSKKRKSEELHETLDDTTQKQREAKQKKLEYLLEEFDLEVNSRIQQMQNQASILAFSLKNVLEIELIKLPPRIKNMTMKDLLSKENSQVPQSAKLLRSSKKTTK